MNLIKELPRLITLNIIALALSVPVFIALLLAIDFLDICMMGDYMFTPIAILWPWAIWRLSKGKSEVPLILTSTAVGCALSVVIVRDSFIQSAMNWLINLLTFP